MKLSEVIAASRAEQDRQADELLHVCAVHSSDQECDGSPFCHSFCGRKLDPQFRDDGVECVVCNDLLEATRCAR